MYSLYLITVFLLITLQLNATDWLCALKQNDILYLYFFSLFGEIDKGNTPLHYAARAECREAMELLLARGSYIGHRNRFGVPPLAHIAPGILQGHLDECLTSANERTEEYEIIMDYRNLVPHEANWGTDEDYLKHRRSSSERSGHVCSETEALLYIANQKNLRHLLKHPLLSSFLYLKYLRIRHVLYVNFLLYLIFFVLLIRYIWVITSDAPDIEGTTLFYDSRCFDDKIFSNMY